jgi:hypothetical protein
VKRIKRQELYANCISEKELYVIHKELLKLNSKKKNLFRERAKDMNDISGKWIY